MTKDPQGVSIREFARREGVSDMLVRRALKRTRIKALPDGTLDPALVGTQWRKRNATDEGAAGQSASKGANSGANTEANSSQPDSGAKGLTYGEALRLKENWLALLRRLEYEQKSGSLVELAVAQNVVFELCREQRDAWLAWPAKVAPFLAMEFAIDDLDRLTTTLSAHVHQQLADLGEPEARFCTDTDPGESRPDQAHRP
jgi:hypothetical protein